MGMIPILIKSPPLASAQLLSSLDLWNSWNPFNRIRIIMGKLGCTQIQTSSSWSSEQKKDFSNFGGDFCQKTDQTSGRNIPNPKNRLKKSFFFSGLQELEVRICVQPNFPIIILILLNRSHKFQGSRGLYSSELDCFTRKVGPITPDRTFTTF